MDLSSVTDRIKAVPPIAWVIGIGIVILFVVVKGGGSTGAGSAGTASGGTTATGGGGGGDTPPDIGQQIVDLASLLAANTEADATFRKDIQDYIATAAPTASGITPGGLPQPTLPPVVKPPTTIPPLSVPAAVRNRLWASNISSAIVAKYDPAKLALAIRRAGPGTQSAKTAYGSVINTEDIERAMKRSGISYGRLVDPADIDKLLKKQGIDPKSALVKP